MGKSRSTTILTAYLLSRTSTLTPKETIALIRQSQPMAEPNKGFMSQLLLYHSMHCPASPASHPVYQRWLYQRELEASRAYGIAPETIRFSDESSASSTDNSTYQRWLAESEAEAGIALGNVHDGIPFRDRSNDTTIAALGAEPSGSTLPPSSSSSFRCRRCRTPLATSQYLIPHHQPPLSAAAPPQPSRPASLLLAPSTPCAHLFLEPLSWMRPELEQGKLDGRLECPNAKCGANVGKYAWQGMRCSCGEWVVPGISIARGRVDEVVMRRRSREEGGGG